MRAAFLTGYGAEEVMGFGEVPEPVRAQGQALIEVKAAGVNPVEVAIRAGAFRNLPYRFPQVPGFDISGVILEVPDGSPWQVGQEVYARLPSNAPGAYAERAVVPVSLLAAKPKRLSHLEAASLPTVALTTWQAFIERARLQEGERVLIQAGAGGVGTFAIQLARHLGAHVTATAGASNQDFLRQLGVDRAVDYTRERFEDHGLYDVVYDGVGGELIERSISTLAPGGRYVGLVKVADAQAYRSLGLPEAVAAAAAAGVAPYIELARRRGGSFHGLLTRPDGEQLGQIGALVDAGVIQASVSSVFRLDQLTEAYAEMASGRTRGKVVIDVTT